MTEAILKMQPSKEIPGFPWLNAGEVRNLPASALASNILCRRHNSMLAVFDQCGFGVYSALATRIWKEERQPIKHRTSGHDFERWLLQRLCAGHYSKSFMKLRQSISHFKLDVRLVLEAFYENKWQSGAGLYITPSKPEFVGEGTEHAPSATPSEKKSLGVA
jgi:hypothetical protein